MNAQQQLPHEQSLINELILMIAKMGGNAVMKDLIEQVDTDGDPKTWTAEEIARAVDYVKWQNSYFARADAMAVIDRLMANYKISGDDVCRMKE